MTGCVQCHNAIAALTQRFDQAQHRPTVVFPAVDQQHSWALSTPIPDGQAEAVVVDGYALGADPLSGLAGF